MPPDILDIASLQSLYRKSAVNPIDVMAAVLERCESYSDKAVWISRVEASVVLGEASALTKTGPSLDKPLWGIPFAVKDNIDCIGLPTTAGCLEFSYSPAHDAIVVARLKAAGAILIGKTNLDQFATGLTGTRSPFGSPRSVFDDAFISGGSSSGSAVAVAAGLVSFALGTDTAGSGRIPAAFNNIVGIKPSKGLLSTRGMVSACRSLDCISIFSASVGDGVSVQRICQDFDPDDPYARQEAPQFFSNGPLRVGILRAADREFFGDQEYSALYDATIEALRASGSVIVEFDYAPFQEAAALLYDGPWIAERLAAIESFMATQEASIEPTVRAIIAGGREWSAVEAFKGQYTLRHLRRRANAEWQGMDLMLLPTAPTSYKVSDVQADPMRLNGNLGHYTNFVNLLDCSAIAVPAGFRSDGIPFGVTLVAPAFYDADLASAADALHRSKVLGVGKFRTMSIPEGALDRPCAASTLLPLFVVGAHLSGMPLNHELTDRGGVLLHASRTAADYRLFALAATTPPKPGLTRSSGFCGPGIIGEVWGLSAAAFGDFVNAVPSPLGIGKILLEDGTMVSGFLCQEFALSDATEITHHEGWRAYIGFRSNDKPPPM